MDDLTAKSIFNQVKRTYNEIASDFSRTRNYNWEELKKLAKLAKKWDRVLDLGCGNGRLAELFDENIEYIGIDNSEKLISIAQKRYPQRSFQLFDGLKIPFSENSFNKVYCIAVLHHIPGQKMRQEFLLEIKRVLRREGKLILTVWSAKNYKKATKLLRKHNLKKFLGLSNLDFSDVILPWGQERTPRYVHFFKEKELVKQIEKAGFHVKESGFLKRDGKEYNMCVVATK